MNWTDRDDDGRSGWGITLLVSVLAVLVAGAGWFGYWAGVDDGAQRALASFRCAPQVPCPAAPPIGDTGFYKADGQPYWRLVVNGEHVPEADALLRNCFEKGDPRPRLLARAKGAWAEGYGQCLKDYAFPESCAPVSWPGSGPLLVCSKP